MDLSQRNHKRCFNLISSASYLKSFQTSESTLVSFGHLRDNSTVELLNESVLFALKANQTSTVTWKNIRTKIKN